MNTHLHTKRAARIARVRGKMNGTAAKPRINVYRSNAHISIQAIDDVAGTTLAAAHDLRSKTIKGTKIERAQQVAASLAEQLKKLKVTTLQFDRGYYKYHGRVKAVAETLREQGLKV